MPTHDHDLIGLISAAVAPAALITACAILLSGYTGKHSNLADQIRALSAELRAQGVEPVRAESVRRQLRLFRRRVNLLWSATVFLSVALLLFLVTVFFVISVEREARLGTLGAFTVISGLICIAVAVWLDLTEIVIARRTMAEELNSALDVPAKRAGDGHPPGE